MSSLGKYKKRRQNRKAPSDLLRETQRRVVERKTFVCHESANNDKNSTSDQMATSSINNLFQIFSTIDHGKHSSL